MEVQIQVSPKQSIEFENRFDPTSLLQLVECPCCFRDVVGDKRTSKTMMGNLSSQFTNLSFLKESLARQYTSNLEHCPVCEKRVDDDLKYEIEVSLGMIPLQKIYSDSVEKVKDTKDEINFDNWIHVDNYLTSCVKYIQKLSETAVKTQSIKVTMSSKSALRMFLEILGNALSEAVDIDLATKSTEANLSTLTSIKKCAKVFMYIIENLSKFIDTIGFLAVTDGKKLCTKITKYFIIGTHYFEKQPQNFITVEAVNVVSHLLDCVEMVIDIAISTHEEENYINLLKLVGHASIFISENISKIVGILTNVVLQKILGNLNYTGEPKELNCYKVFEKIRVLFEDSKIINKNEFYKPHDKTYKEHDTKKEVQNIIEQNEERLVKLNEQQKKLYSDIIENVGALKSKRGDIELFDRNVKEIDEITVANILLKEFKRTISAISRDPRKNGDTTKKRESDIFDNSNETDVKDSIKRDLGYIKLIIEGENLISYDFKETINDIKNDLYNMLEELKSNTDTDIIQLNEEVNDILQYIDSIADLLPTVLTFLKDFNNFREKYYELFDRMEAIRTNDYNRYEPDNKFTNENKNTFLQETLKESFKLKQELKTLKIKYNDIKKLKNFEKLKDNLKKRLTGILIPLKNLKKEIYDFIELHGKEETGAQVLEGNEEAEAVLEKGEEEEEEEEDDEEENEEENEEKNEKEIGAQLVKEEEQDVEVKGNERGNEDEGDNLETTNEKFKSQGSSKCQKNGTNITRKNLIEEYTKYKNLITTRKNYIYDKFIDKKNEQILKFNNNKNIVNADSFENVNNLSVDQMCLVLELISPGNRE